MNSELEEINSDVLLDMKIRTYNYLAKSVDIQKKSELLLASLLKIHNDKCLDISCPCKRRKFLYDPGKLAIGGTSDQFHRDNVFVKHYLEKMLKDGMKKFKDSKLLRLDHIFF